MTRLLSRLAHTVGVHRGEERLFLWGAATLFLLGWASVSLTNVSETLFLKRVGVDRLPLVFLANGVLLVGTTYGMSHIAARVDRRLLLAATFGGLAAGVLVLWLLLLSNFSGVFVLLVIASKQLDAIALIAFWIVVGSLLHGRQAKRLYAPIIAGGTLGRILGSFASGLVGNAFGIAALLPVSAAAVGCACVLAGRIRTVAPARLTQAAKTLPRPVPLARFAPLWGESRLFRILAFGSLLGGTLGPMLYFQFSYVVDAATHGHNGELRLLDLYAKLRGFINAGVLAMQLVGTGRIFRRIGVPLAATLSPLVYLLGFLGVSTRLDLSAGIGAVATTNLQDKAIQEPAQRILVTLFPERLRTAATSLIEGPVQRLGGALGNVLVLTAIAVGTPASVGLTALPIALVWFAVAVSMWRIYPTLLLEVARSTGRAEAVRPEMVDPATMRAVEKSLADRDPRLCRAACELALEAPLRRSATALTRALQQAPAANRPLLVETLNQAVRRGAAQPFLSAHLAAQLEPYLADPAMSALERAHLVEAYGALLPPPRHQADLNLLEWLRRDHQPAVQLAARLQMRRLAPASAGGDFDAIIAEALAGADAAARHVALEALGRALLTADEDGDWEVRVAMAAARLHDPSDRRCAAELLAEITAKRGPEVNPHAEPLLAYTRDADPRVRTAAIRFIGDAGLDRYTGWLIGRLAADDDSEAAEAAEALLALGPRTMSALLDALHRDKRVIREAVYGVLTDMPVNARALHVALERELRVVRRVILVRHGLRGGVASDLVLQRLGERITEGMHTVLFLLATILHEDRIAALAHLLARSPDGRGRALLVEALEALIPPREWGRLLPLLESESAEGHAEDCARILGRPLPTFDEAAREALADRDALTRTFLAATLELHHLRRLEGAPILASDRDLEHHRAPGREARQDSMLKRVEIILHLRTLDLFSRLTTRELSDLAAAVHEESFEAGDVVVREGELGDGMYVIVDGEVRVTREGELVSTFKSGELLGEMSVFDGAAYFATATALTPVRLLRLERNDLLRLMDDQPSIAISICQQLSRHVRDLLTQIQGRHQR